MRHVELVEGTSTPHAPAPEGVPPWLAKEAPIHPTPQMQTDAWASRRFPRPVPSPTIAEAWKQVWDNIHIGIDFDASDERLREVAKRVLERLSLEEPPQDADADALLMAYALTTSEPYGKTALGVAVVDYLVAQYGVAMTLAIWLGAQAVEVGKNWNDAEKMYYHHFSLTVTQPLHNGFYGPFGQAEAALRGYLAVADEAVWHSCAECIEAAVSKLHPSRQPVLALLLPERPELSNALVLRLCEDQEPPETVHWLLLTATDPAALALAAKISLGWSQGFWNQRKMIASLLQERGALAVAALEKGAGCDEAGDALTTIGTPEAVMALAKVASSSKRALARLALAVERWPQAALVALARAVAAGGKDAGLFSIHLTRLLSEHGGEVERLRPWLDAGAQGVIERMLARLSAPQDIADNSELPEILRAPPWLSKVKKKAAGVLELDVLELPPLEQWEPGARESALILDGWRYHRNQRLEASEDVEKQLAELMAFDDWSARETDFARGARQAITTLLRERDVQGLIALWRDTREGFRQLNLDRNSFNPDDVAPLPPDIALPFWNALADKAKTHFAPYLMASFGLPALPGLQALVRAKPAECMELALNFASAELAATAARAFAKLKKVYDTGQRWLLKYPEHAACALIAPALGKASEARDCAGAALRLLYTQGHAELLFEVAARYQNPAVIDALHAVLNESPLDRFPSKRAKLPAWWQPRTWSTPVLLNGKALPLEAIDHLGQMLTFPAHEERYAGLADVKHACTPDSLAGFAWDVFNAWLANGAAGKENWALGALGIFGNDDTARKLTPLIRAWPGESAHARAVTALDVLAAIGTDVALMMLNGIAQKLKFKGLQDKAREKIRAIAEARELSTEELEDRLVPDLGLDERGTLRLDFGPRAFMVGFDETLKPYVRELDAEGQPGKRLSDLPKPKKTDDAELSKASVERFKLLKKDARTIASQQVLRLETAMCTRRRWTPALFKLFLAQHPLVRHLVQRLVWGVYEVTDGGNDGGELKSLFRVAEDGSATTAQDEPFTLPEGETIRIGVPHALELPEPEAAAFGQLFADYELLQPFTQIGRDTYTLTEAEQATTSLERWKGVKVPTGRVLGLVNTGWRRGSAEDHGCILWFLKPLGGNRVIELNLDPGIYVGAVDEEPEQALTEIRTGPRERWGGLQEPEPFTTLDPIAASELIRDMEALRA